MSRPEVLSSLEQKLAPHHTALLLIDMVNDFVHPEGKTAVRARRPLDHARSVIPAQQRLLAAAREAGVMVVHVQHTTKADHASDSGPWLDARTRATYSVEDICLEGTWGQQVIEELAPAEGEQTVQKYRYSGFPGTSLDLQLRSAGMRTVVCAGVSTNVCVESTAREAFSLDYYVVVAGDACASWSRPLHDSALENVEHRYGRVADVEDIASVWRTG
jgi:nicotinamidase-related amidase